MSLQASTFYYLYLNKVYSFAAQKNEMLLCIFTVHENSLAFFTNFQIFVEAKNVQSKLQTIY